VLEKDDGEVHERDGDLQKLILDGGGEEVEPLCALGLGMKGKGRVVPALVQIDGGIAVQRRFARIGSHVANKRIGGEVGGV
jgi:hypothetical protein